MSVIVNDLTIEPATEPPKPVGAIAERPAKSASGPALAQELEKCQRRQLERALRVRAH